MSDQNINILIADDHEIVRRGVRNLLTMVPGWEVCGEASTGTETVALAARLRPNVIILDISMPPSDGLEVAKELRLVAPESKVLVFSMHNSEEMVRSLLGAGVRGYVLKSDADRFLISAVESVANGQTFFSTEVSDVILGAFVNNNQSDVARNNTNGNPLTLRETEIARLLASGKSNKEIATALFISVKTVETHRRSIMQKLEISSIVELVHWAIRNQLIDTPE